MPPATQRALLAAQARGEVVGGQERVVRIGVRHGRQPVGLNVHMSQRVPKGSKAIPANPGGNPLQELGHPHPDVRVGFSYVPHRANVRAHVAAFGARPHHRTGAPPGRHSAQHGARRSPTAATGTHGRLTG